MRYIVKTSKGQSWIVESENEEKAKELVLGEYAPEYRPENIISVSELDEKLSYLEEYNAYPL